MRLGDVRFMNLAVEEEVTSINAIFGEGTLRVDEKYAILQLPHNEASIKIRFPDDYPASSPIVVGPEASGSHTTRGRAHELVKRVKDLIEREFVSGQPFMYDLLEEMAPSESTDALPGAHTRPFQADDGAREVSAQDVEQVEALQYEHAASPKWTLSKVITEKKSAFVARSVRLTSPEDPSRYVRHLVSTDKKVAKATHNITAWRFRDCSSNVLYQNCDDDGESAAGSRLLHLLELMKVWNCLVVVSRWYGGIHLGPDRFRIINSAARDALIQGGFVDHAKQRK